MLIYANVINTGGGAAVIVDQVVHGAVMDGEAIATSVTVTDKVYPTRESILSLLLSLSHSCSVLISLSLSLTLVLLLAENS